MTDITLTAKRIARRLNHLGAGYGGGFCVFDEDGGGGHFYTGNSFPRLTNGEIKMWVPTHRVTAREVQEMLNAADEDDFAWPIEPGDPVTDDNEYRL